MITPNAATFRANTTYLTDLTGHIQFAGIPPDRIYEIYRDGRVPGFVMGDALAYHFVNLQRVGGTEDPTILEDTLTERRFRTKIMTKHGCDLDLSSMLGTQRSHLPGRYVAHWQGDVDGWIVIDIRNMPRLLLAAVDKTLIKPPAHRLNRDFWAYLVRANNQRARLH